MRFSTRVRYSARALVELSKSYPNGLVSVAAVAVAQNISPKYLERLFHVLRRAKLVDSARGMRGGYTLARPPQEITLLDVYRAVEQEDVQPVHCVEDPAACPMVNVCPTRDTWTEIANSIAAILEGTTIKDLLERETSKKASHCPMYQI